MRLIKIIYASTQPANARLARSCPWIVDNEWGSNQGKMNAHAAATP
jgi:hypothetical protein